MRGKRFVAVGAVLLIWATACSPSPPAASTSSCAGTFEASVDQGPSKGLSLTGDMTIQVEPSGSVKGTLTRSDGAPINVVGQANGRAINLVFDLSGGQYIFGAGTAVNEVCKSEGALGGTFSGPKQGDNGDWIG